MILDSPYISGSITIQNAITASNAVFSGNVIMDAGSIEGTASVAISSSYAATSSFADNFTVAGEIVAQTLHVQQVTSSIVYSSGSNVFGENVSDTQTFTGSLQVSGSTNYLLGSVGIGQTSPNAKLEIYGTANSSPQTSNGGILKINSTATNAIIFGTLSGSPFGTYIQSGGSNTYPLLLNPNGGDVGIGTTSPGQKLEINQGGTGGGEIVRMRYDASYYTDYGSNRINWVGTNQTFSFQNNGSTAIYVNSSSNVGIGTTSPTGSYGKLTVNGSISLLDDQNTKLEIGRYSAGASNSYIKLGANSNSLRITNNTDTADLLYIENGGNVEIRTVNAQLRFQNSVGPAPFIANTGSSGDQDLYISTGGSESMRIDSSGDVRIIYNYAYNLQLSDDGGSGKIYANGDSATLRFGTTDPLASTATERMRIDSSGNVGIGTTSPSTPLEVFGSPAASDSGNISLNTTATTGASRIAFRESSSNVGQIAYSHDNNQVEIIGQEADSDIVFMAGGISEKARILSSGGITFNGDTASANALDDYEEGTWTMGISFGGSSVGVTYQTNAGTYTKIGRQVTATGYLIISNKGSSTGAAEITGLPYTIANGNAFYPSVAVGYLSGISFADTITPFGLINTNKIALYETTNGGVPTQITNADFVIVNYAIIITITYFTA